MMKAATSLLVAACVVGRAVAQSSTTCTQVDNDARTARCLSNDGSNYDFDLSCVQPPQGFGSTPYFSDLAADGSGYIYYLSMTGLPDAPFDKCTLPSNQAAGNVAAQATSDGNFCYAIGQKNTGQWSINSNLGSVNEFIRITYNAFGRNMELDVYCDPDAETPVYEPEGEDTGQGLYIIHVTTKYACKQFAGTATCGATPGDKGGPGGTLFGIFVGFAAVYFIGGYAFLRYSKLKEGNDRIPHYEFWSNLPGLIKDGWAFTKSKTIGGGDGSYESV